MSDLDKKLQEIADRLCQIGTPIIEQVHGHHAKVWCEPTKKGYKIVAEGEDVLFIEFGAGDATMNPMFENYVGVDVYPGAYSEQVGSGEYAETGKWHFGGKTYTEVQPRMGLYDAKLYIQGAAVELAQEVIQL